MLSTLAPADAFQVRDAAPVEAALARAGRCFELPGGPRVKEVRVSAHERFVVCASPEAAARDAAVCARVDAAALDREEKLDGKYLLRSSDPTLSAADIALGYKQLLRVERGWRLVEQVLDLRPVYHRKEDRIRAHVVRCWLAVLLVRVMEKSCGDTWPNLRRELEHLKLGSLRAPPAPSASAPR